MGRVRLRGAVTPLASMGLRGLGLAGRFALMIYLARYLGVEAVGQFGLVYGVVAILPAIAGFGLNFRLNREIVGAPIAIAGAMVRDRLLVTLCVFVALGCVALSLRAAGVALEVAGLPLLCVIALGEGLAFDVHLSLISLERPLLANVLMFLRTSSWIYPFIGLGLAFPELRSFDVLLWFWVGALMMTFLVLAYSLRSWPWREIAEQRIDPTRLRRRLIESWLIYLGDLGIVGSAFLDRFLINFSLGLEQTGIFIFYWSIANSAQLLVGAGVVQPALPHLIAASRQDWSVLRARLHGEMTKVLVCGVAMAVSLFFTMTLVVPYLNRPSLLGQELLFALMLLAAVVRLVSDVANYGLYARAFDKAWSLTNLLGVALSAGYTAIGLQLFGLVGVGLAMVATAASILAVRLLVLARPDVARAPPMAAKGATS